MTNEQFDLLTRLLRMSSKPIIAAARLVLVKGERQADAARKVGCLSNNLARAVTQIRELHENIRKTYK